MTFLAALGFAVLLMLAAASRTAGHARRRTRHLAETARIAHELRGGLGGVEVGLECLGRLSGLGAEGTARIDAVRTQAERAVVATADLEALMTGCARACEPVGGVGVDAGALVRRRVRAWSRIGPRGRSVVLRWRAGSVVVQAGAPRLAQALDNLIANALEHGRGRVTVEGMVAADTLRLTVSDLGPGIATPCARRRGGGRPAVRGHGLEVARRAVEPYGGTVVAAPGVAPRIELPIQRALP